MFRAISSCLFSLGMIIASLESSSFTSANIISLPINIPNGTVFNSWWTSSRAFEIADFPSEIGLPHLPGSGIWYLKSSNSSKDNISFHLTFDLWNPALSPCFLANTVIKIEYSSHLAPTTLWPVWREDYLILSGSRDDERWITIAKTIDMTKSSQIEITGIVQPGGYFAFNKIYLEFIIDESMDNCDEPSTITTTIEELITDPTIPTIPETTSEEPSTTDNFYQNECTVLGNSPCPCVQNPSCAFCAQADFLYSRCDLADNLLGNGCTPVKMCGAIPTPVIEVLPSHQKNTLPAEATELTVCCNVTTINVTFHLAAHPVDVYLLMDFSNSMWDDKDNVVRLSSELLTAVKDMSPDHRFGFGTFVDKPMNPFGHRTDYSFRNNFPLTEDIDEFTETIKAVPIKSGLDNPESQLDGIFQVASCTDLIGWRSNARHILILMTDASYHKAMDGAQEGLPPFEGYCALDNLGYYQDETQKDYPSEDQIVEIVKEKNIIPIFAITSAQERFYADFVRRISPSAMGTLSSDSSNVVDVIVEEYNKIVSRVELEHDVEGDDGLVIKFYSSCNGNGTDHETTVCEGLDVNGSVTFTLKFDASNCPSEESGGVKMLKVQPKGLPSFAEIALEIICKQDWS